MSGRRCPACDADALRPWRDARATDPDAAGAEWFALVRCARCGSAALADAPPPPAALYATGSYAPTRPAARALAWPAEWLGHRLRRRLLGLDAGARVLEVGAGDGSFVSALRRRGIAAEGIDPAGTGDIRRLPAQELVLEPESLDAVVLWHVLEHLDDPAPVLRQLAGALRPGGRLLVATPDLASLQARIGGDRWFHQDVPRHRILLTHAGLDALLGRCGLRIAASSTLVPEQNLLGMWQTLLNRITTAPNVAFGLAKGQRPAHGRDLVATVVAAPLLVLPAVALEAAAGVAGRAGTRAVVAIRDTA